MNPARHHFLSFRHPPARLNMEEAAWFLGFLPHEIPILIAANLLKPLGSPAPNAVKYFALFELRLLRRNLAWLAKASNAISRHWKTKNQRHSMK